MKRSRTPNETVMHKQIMVKRARPINQHCSLQLYLACKIATHNGLMLVELFNLFDSQNGYGFTGASADEGCHRCVVFMSTLYKAYSAHLFYRTQIEQRLLSQQYEILRSRDLTRQTPYSYL